MLETYITKLYDLLCCGSNNCYDESCEKIYTVKDTPNDTLFQFSGSTVSDIGLVRPNNEDNYILGKYMNSNFSDKNDTDINFLAHFGEWQFAGVFDGMGGGNFGELASYNAANIFLNKLSNITIECSKMDIDYIVRLAFLQANNVMIDFQKSYNIAGTTGTLFCTNGHVFKIYHLGDSRAYHFHNNKLIQLTRDQTLAQMKMDSGITNIAETDRYKLIEYIGADWTRKNLKPTETAWIPVQSCDYFLLCSDGLYSLCTNHEIEQILQKKIPIKEKTFRLVQRAISKGGIDNVTCVLIKISNI